VILLWQRAHNWLWRRADNFLSVIKGLNLQNVSLLSFFFMVASFPSISSTKLKSVRQTHMTLQIYWCNVFSKQFTQCFDIHDNVYQTWTQWHHEKSFYNWESVHYLRKMNLLWDLNPRLTHRLQSVSLSAQGWSRKTNKQTSVKSPAALKRVSLH